MGKAQSIAEMEAQEDTYRNYIKKIEAELEDKSKSYGESMSKAIDTFYSDNKYTKLDIVGGKNSDFMQKSDWSLANVKAILDVIGKSLFGDGVPPPGVEVAKPPAASAALAATEGLEVYIAGKAFQIISGIVDSFGSASSVSFNSSFKHEALGNGLHLFVTVVCDSYKSTDFFSNNEIYQYLYLYEVKFSVEEAGTQAKMATVTLLEDQIATFVKLSEGLIDRLTNGDITIEQYQSSSAIYDTLIEEHRKKLDSLKSRALA